MKENDGAVLIVGATGTVGAEAMRATLARGGRVRALVRSAASAARLPSEVEAVHGDLRDAAAVQKALVGVCAALYVSPHEPDEEALADAFVRACETAVARVVFVGVHVDGGNRLVRAAKRWSYCRLVPHYAPKFRLSERVRRSRANPVVLMASNYFQNDELFWDQILDGVFSQPLARAVNRVDVRDVGEAAARALLDPSLPSGAYSVVGPESLSGEACAATWSRVLRREVPRWERREGDGEAAGRGAWVPGDVLFGEPGASGRGGAGAAGRRGRARAAEWRAAGRSIVAGDVGVLAAGGQRHRGDPRVSAIRAAGARPRGEVQPPSEVSVVGALILAFVAKVDSATRAPSTGIPVPPKGPTVEYGKYMVQEMDCVGCHTEGSSPFTNGSEFARVVQCLHKRHVWGESTPVHVSGF